MEPTGWVKDVYDWIQANPNWTGILIFLFAFAESILLVGIIFPGAAFLVSLYSRGIRLISFVSCIHIFSGGQGQHFLF